MNRLNLKGSMLDWLLQTHPGATSDLLADFKPTFGSSYGIFSIVKATPAQITSLNKMSTQVNLMSNERELYRNWLNGARVEYEIWSPSNDRVAFVTQVLWFTVYLGILSNDSIDVVKVHQTFDFPAAKSFAEQASKLSKDSLPNQCADAASVSTILTDRFYGYKWEIAGDELKFPCGESKMYFTNPVTLPKVVMWYSETNAGRLRVEIRRLPNQTLEAQIKREVGDSQWELLALHSLSLT